MFLHSEAVPDREHFFRIVEVWEEETQRSFTFLTNHLGLAATTISGIYKDRWRVESFFKAIKQNLKIQTFLGTNANVVKTQIWTALIAMLVLRYLQLMSTFGWLLSNLAALLRHQLFVYRDLLKSIRWFTKPAQLCIIPALLPFPEQSLWPVAGMQRDENAILQTQLQILRISQAHPSMRSATAFNLRGRDYA